MNTDRRRRLITTVKITALTYQNLLGKVTQEDATTFRDSRDADKGWTALEVLCHLRDFDEVFLSRAQQIIAEDMPALSAYDHEQMAIDGDYNQQDKDTVLTAFIDHREQFRDFFKSLTDDDWARAGKHPEREHPFTLEDALLQVAGHDATHLEQITRILAERTP
ncbi:MAG: DinB family protein [Chloroflexota bacterium]